MNFLNLIEAKRDGQTFSPVQINELLLAYTAGRIPDYQMAALLMAIYFRGLNVDETRAMTLAMRDSGEVLKFPADPRPLVDKHSTGGVGDKVSLVLAPLLVCLGFRVPMISGRGLGLTGGTLDKLESIPGFRTALPGQRLIEQVQNIGCAMCGQTDRMVPADKALYALRDVTGTVPSIPLITASVLSKKLAENISALVLDVKFGTAAFMQTKEKARDLAQAMVRLGNDCGVNTRALLTNMDVPLGRAAGNWLEVKEAVACLECRGPDDLQELVVECAAQLLEQTQRKAGLAQGRALAVRCLASGEPRKKWDELLLAQGADVTAFQHKLSLPRTAPAVMECRALQHGYVERCDARVIGELVRDLGGGRFTKETLIQLEVGVDELAKPGEALGANSILGRVHARNEAEAAAGCARLQSAFTIAEGPTRLPPLIQEVVV
ncbi:MAG: thymidine phosphorylase [Verrucomicrobiota bacterium]